MEMKIESSKVYIDDFCWRKFSSYMVEYEKFLIIIDKRIMDLYPIDIEELKGHLNHRLFIITDPEKEKDMLTLQELTNVATEFELNRQDAVIAIGGGATLDLAGLFSSIYKRGLDYFSFPTTLMSQVDSAIGGKTAVNFNGVKNVIGTFYNPKAIFIDVRYLSSLAMEEYLSGLGEVVKYSLINEELFDLLTKSFDKILARDEELKAIIQLCVLIKKRFVEVDYYDTKGTRIALNLGHTLGHLIEYKEPYYLNHGISVAVGLDFSLFVALKKGLISRETYMGKKAIVDKLLGKLRSLDLSLFSGTLNKLQTDKKFAKGKIQYVVITNENYTVLNLEPLEFRKYYLEYIGVEN